MTTTGTIEGTVMDPSGKAVPGAKITLTNEATRDFRSSNSGEVGTFNFTAVVPGTYSVKAEHPDSRVPNGPEFW
jgi:protocatechuate 3,4-dioxygenase beta subunit